MARPIAPTPILSGQDAIDFITSINNVKKVSEAERSRIFEGSKRIEKMFINRF